MIAFVEFVRFQFVKIFFFHREKRADMDFQRGYIARHYKKKIKCKRTKKHTQKLNNNSSNSYYFQQIKHIHIHFKCVDAMKLERKGWLYVLFVGNSNYCCCCYL